MRCSKTLLLKLSNVVLLIFHYADLGNNSDWSCREGNSLQPISSTAQKWVVTLHQCGVSSIVPQTSFHGETSGGVTKCRLFSQVMYGIYTVPDRYKIYMLLKVFVVRNTVYRVVIDGGICSEKITEVKVPIWTNFFYCLIRIYTSSNDVLLRNLSIPTKRDFLLMIFEICCISLLSVGPEQWRSRDVGSGSLAPLKSS